jgi:hypothetical protein
VINIDYFAMRKQKNNFDDLLRFKRGTSCALDQ